MRFRDLRARWIGRTRGATRRGFIASVPGDPEFPYPETQVRWDPDTSSWVKVTPEEPGEE